MFQRYANPSPAVRGTFFRRGGVWISRNPGGFDSCPPYTIASVTLRRVQPGVITLPAGYDADALERITDRTGFVGLEVVIDDGHARELFTLGTQLLYLADDAIAPQPGWSEAPGLSHSERESIGWLVYQVASL